MITNEGKRICDHETKRGSLWCACRKPATVKVPSKVVSYMELDYCEAHAPQAVPWVEVDQETAYGVTTRLSRSIRVF